MAYTIQFLNGGYPKAHKVIAYLRDRIARDGRFSACLDLGEEKTTKEDRARIGKVHYLPCIFVSRVRLVKKKAYCGNHPGECPVSDKPKPISSRLEWEDWVAFHALVNRVLNRFRADANVWSLPYDVRGRMWIRKGTKARVKYDWTETTDAYARVIRIWNQGTDDQFLKEVA